MKEPINEAAFEFRASLTERELESIAHLVSVLSEPMVALNAPSRQALEQVQLIMSRYHETVRKHYKPRQK